jgi:ubiquinone/menaquinone biosynthesis C-methylase UbiE
MTAMTPYEAQYYELNRRVYPKLAPVYDFVALPIRKLRRRVVALAGIEARSRVLDVATGTGAQARAFAAVAREVVGIDLSAAMLRVASRKHRLPNLQLERADATALPFADGSFDAACISFALHEMPPSVRERVLREMTRVTKRGGTLVVVDYALPRSAVARTIVVRAVRLYERDSYAEFVRSDLPALLRNVGIEPRADQPALGGLARVIVGAVAP